MLLKNKFIKKYRIRFLVFLGLLLLYLILIRLPYVNVIIGTSESSVYFCTIFLIVFNPSLVYAVLFTSICLCIGMIGAIFQISEMYDFYGIAFISFFVFSLIKYLLHAKDENN